MKINIHFKRRVETIGAITEAIILAHEHDLAKELNDEFEELSGETLDTVLAVLAQVANDALTDDLTNVINASESDNLSPEEEERLDELYADITGVKEHLTELCEWFAMLKQSDRRR